jgi:hypothetical protein
LPFFLRRSRKSVAEETYLNTDRKGSLDFYAKRFADKGPVNASRHFQTAESYIDRLYRVPLGDAEMIVGNQAFGRDL